MRSAMTKAEALLMEDLVAITLEYNISKEVARKHLETAVRTMKRDSEVEDRMLGRVVWRKTTGDPLGAILRVIPLLLVMLAMLFPLTANAQHQVGLNWGTSSGANGYNVYRADNSNCGGSPSFSQLATGIVPNAYVDNAVLSGNSYCYKVTAFNGSGESAPSNLAPALVPTGGSNYPYGSNCTNGCGQPITGNIIIPSSINCELHDTAGTNHIQCQKSTLAYGQDALPLTIDGTQLDVYWTNSVPASCGIVLGALSNNSDRNQWQYDSPGVFHVGTSCHVNIKGLVPASANGNGPQGPDIFYLVSNPNATTGDPKGHYDPGVNTFPGPQCYNGSTACYFNVAPPNPTALLPLQWNATPAGVVRAIRGHQAEIPLNILWVGGNATTVSALGTCDSSKNLYLGHVYAWGGSGGWAAPNSGTWYVCKQVGSNFQWVSNGSSLPAFVATSVTATDASNNVYTCPGSVNGGEDPNNNYAPKDICTGTAGSLGASITPFYPGQWVSGGSASDYRSIHYNSTKGYWMDTNAASTPFNAQPTALLQYYPSASALTGNITVQACFDTYTDTTLTIKAGGTNNFCVSYTINVGDETAQAQSDPASYTPDSNEPAYHNNLVNNATYMCSRSSGAYSMDYFNIGVNYWMWLTMGPGDWGEFNTGNYDNSRVFAQSGDFLLAKMDGTAWPARSPSTAYGSSYDLMEITDTNGHIWVATVNGGTTSSGSVSWPSNPVAGVTTQVDGSQTWKYVGDAAYWRRCAHNALIPYMNQVVEQTPAPWGQFPGGLLKQLERTGDAVLKGTTTYTGVMTTALRSEVNASVGAGAFSQFSASAGRPPAYELMSLGAWVRAVCKQGNCNAFFNNPELVALARWDQNAIINYQDIHIGSDPISTDYTRTYWPTFDPLHIGVGTEAQIEWTVRMLELGHPEQIDARIVPEMKRILDFAWTHWYNQCRVQGEGKDNFSFSYNPMDFQTCAINEPYYPELTGTIQAAYDWLFRYCGGDTTNCKLSDGTAYNVAGNTIRKHQYDGRNCSNPQGKWYCQTYGIPYAGCSGVPKAFGQCDKWTTGNSLQYNYGAWDWNEDDQSPQHNPCWTGGTDPCSTPTPYPDTEAPYGVQLLSTGQDDPGQEGHFLYQQASITSVAIAGNTATIAAPNSFPVGGSIAISGLSHTFLNGNWSVTASDGATFQFHVSHSDLATSPDSGTATIGTTSSPVLNPTSTTADLQMNFYEHLQSLRWDYGTDQTCSTGSVNFSGSPTLVNSANQLWNYTTHITGLAPGTKYWFRYCATDEAGNTGCNTCTAIPGGFRGGSINASTTAINGLTIITTTLPNGRQGTAYNQTLQAAGGQTPYTWSLAAGALPDGLNLNASTGAITGTPTTVGTFPFTVQVKDATNTTAQQPLTIVINPSTALSITTTALPGATFNVPYLFTLTAAGGVPPYTWSHILGVLPSFMSLDPATGTISGTPTACASYLVTYQVTDQQSTKANKPLTLTITGCTSNLTITTTFLAGGTQNQLYDCGTCLQATGGQTPYTWSILSGSLPAGLTLNASTGQITGTPTGTGTSNFTVQVKDANNVTVTKPLSISITANLQITTVALPSGSVGVAYNASMSASGGVLPYSWCIQNGTECSIGVGKLPDGVTMDTNGVFTGTPSGSGTFSFDVQVTDADQTQAVGPFQITISTVQQNSVTFSGTTNITGNVTVH